MWDLMHRERGPEPFIVNRVITLVKRYVTEEPKREQSSYGVDLCTYLRRAESDFAFVGGGGMPHGVNIPVLR